MKTETHECYVKNTISVTLINKELLKEFTPQIDESKINLKWRC